MYELIFEVCSTNWDMPLLIVQLFKLTKTRLQQLIRMYYMTYLTKLLASYSFILTCNLPIPYHHTYRCEGCIDSVFTRPSAACPECGLALRRNQYRAQQFEDSYIEKEVEIRKKVLKE